MILIYTAQSLTQYVKSYITGMAGATRKLYNANVAASEHKSKLEINRLLSKLINKVTLYGGINQIILGWLKPELDKIERKRLRKWNYYYNIDASERTIPHKFARQPNDSNHYRLNASDSHIADGWGLLLGYIRFLEKSGESYEVIFVQQMSSIIGTNMEECEECKDFGVHISLDIGTKVNTDNIRNCLIEGMRNYLQLQSHEYQYENEQGVEFDLRSFNVTVLCKIYID